MFENLKEKYKKIEQEYRSGEVKPVLSVEQVESAIKRFNHAQIKAADYSIMFSALAALSVAAMATVSAPSWVTMFHLAVGAFLLAAYIRRTK